MLCRVQEDSLVFDLRAVREHEVDDLAAAMNANPTARANYDAFSASVKKAYLWWIESAKRPATRAQRVSDSVWLLERGIREPKRVSQ